MLYLSALISVIRFVCVGIILLMMGVRAMAILFGDNYYGKAASLFIYSLWLFALIAFILGGIKLC